MQIDEIEIDNEVLQFAKQMQIEINNNSHKGSIFNWCNDSDFPNWLYEFEYHKSKLIAAIMAKDEIQKNEYAADLGNYLAAICSRPELHKLQKSSTLCKIIDVPKQRVEEIDDLPF